MRWSVALKQGDVAGANASIRGLVVARPRATAFFKEVLLVLGANMVIASIMQACSPAGKQGRNVSFQLIFKVLVCRMFQ